jgi:hypothetical protein
LIKLFAQAQATDHRILGESKRVTDLEKLFRKTGWFWSRGFSHQDFPPDGNEALLPALALKRIRFSLISFSVTAGKSYVFDSLAVRISRDLVPRHAWAKQAVNYRPRSMALFT